MMCLQRYVLQSAPVLPPAPPVVAPATKTTTAAATTINPRSYYSMDLVHQQHTGEKPCQHYN